jgi:hypothetical protein
VGWGEGVFCFLIAKYKNKDNKISIKNNKKLISIFLFVIVKKYKLIV